MNAAAARQVEAKPYAWPHDGPVAPARTALLAIDMQRDFCAAAGYFAGTGADAAAAAAIVPKVAAALAAARAAGLLVIHTREGHRPDLSDLSAQKRFRAARAGAPIGAGSALGRRLVRGEPGWAIVSALEPRAGEPVIDKPGYSAFHATDLDHLLRRRRIEALILCGVTTDVCVHSTLRAAIDLGYDCLLLEDACAAADPSLHAAAIRMAQGEGGIFGATAEVAGLVRALAVGSD